MKKVLAWAVVLALVLSSFTMAFADQTKTSKDFKDGSQIQYTEAVDVMVATGVINGYPDGTFGPQKTVKRSEMAKMISVMLNAGSDIGDQYKDACTFADSKDHWAAGYIAYCAAQHIIDGRSADVFDPEKEVTGTEVAKMALTSLGYDSKIQGYTGENWAANVLKDANKIELFDGLASDFVPGDPCSREAAAQILFNTLQSNMVEYENGTSVSVGDDVNVVVSSKIQDQTWKPAGTEVVDGEEVVIPNAKDDNGDGVKQLYEDVFGGDLSKERSAEGDDYGRAGHDWTYNEDAVGTYGDSADATFVAEKNQTIADAIKAFNKDYDTANLRDVVLNGGDATKETPVPAGTTIEITKDKKNVTKVVAYYYELVKITEVDTDVTAKDQEDGVTARISFAGKGAAVGNDVKDTDFPGFDASTYEKDSYVAVFYNTAKAKVVESFVPETKSGEITKTTKTALTIDGTDYTMSVEKGAVPFYAGSADAIKAKASVDLYLDKNGYAIGSVEQESESTTLYGVVTDMTWSSSEAQSLKEDQFKNYLKSVSYTIMDATGAEKQYKLGSDFIDELYEADNYTIVENWTPYLGYNDKEEFIGYMVKFTLDADENLASISAKYDDYDDEFEMDEDGIVDGTVIVSDDVAVFEYNTADEKWDIFKFDSLVDAKVAATWFVEDGDIVALQTEGLLDATNEVIGFFESVSVASDGDGAYATVNVLVDGTSTPYETKHNKDITEEELEAQFADFDTDELIYLSLNKDKKVEEFKAEDEIAIEDDPAKEFGTEKARMFDFDYVKVDAVSGSNVTVDGTIMTIKKAKVYKAYFDSEGEELLLKSVSSSSILEGGYVKLYQINPESNAWDVVVYMSAADYEGLI